MRQDPKVIKVNQDLQVNQAQEDFKAAVAFQAVEEHLEKLACLESQVKLELMVGLDLRVYKDLKVPLGHQDLLEELVQRAQWVILAVLVALAIMEFLDCKAIQDRRDLEEKTELLVLLDHQEQLDQQVKGGIPEPLVCQVRLVLLDPKDHRAGEEPRVRMAGMVHKEPLEKQDKLDLLVHLEALDLLEPLATLEPMVFKVDKEKRAQMVRVVSLVQWET